MQISSILSHKKENLKSNYEQIIEPLRRSQQKIDTLFHKMTISSNISRRLATSPKPDLAKSK